MNNPLNCTKMQRLFDLEVCKTGLSRHLVARIADSLNPRYNRQYVLHRVLCLKVSSDKSGCYECCQGSNQQKRTRFLQTAFTYWLRKDKHPKEGLPGNSWLGCAARFSNPDLISDQKCHFLHPFSDLGSKIHTRFQT